MIVTFQSPAAADVIMFGDVAHHMMDIMGKTRDAKGIITVEQLPGAIAALRSAIEADKRRQQGVDDDDRPENESDGAGGKRPYVSLAQRGVPLLELLEWSLKKNKPVMWGV